MSFTLEQLRCFVTVAKTKHFGKAADELAMTQPPLSRQIQKLEKTVGTTLLIRDRRRVELTEAGNAFLQEATFILERSQHAAEQARLISQGAVGSIDLGFTSGAGFSILGKILSTAAARLPAVKLNLHEMVTLNQVEAIYSGKIHLGFGRVSSTLENIDAFTVLAENLLLAAPENHPLATKPNLQKEDISSYPLLLHDRIRANYFYDLVIRHFPASALNPIHEIAQISTMVELVSENLGIALVPSSAAKLRIKGVRFREFGDLEPHIAKLQALTLSSAQNPIVERLIPLLRHNLHEANDYDQCSQSINQSKSSLRQE